MEQIVELAHAHTDKRRTITECVGPNGDWSMKGYVIHQAKLPLGEHFHEKTTETFTIIKGGGMLLRADVTKDQDGLPRLGSAVTSQAVHAGATVCIRPYTAHTFILEPGSEMICFSDRPFDPDDTDMISFNLA